MVQGHGRKPPNPYSVPKQHGRRPSPPKARQGKGSASATAPVIGIAFGLFIVVPVLVLGFVGVVVFA